VFVPLPAGAGPKQASTQPQPIHVRSVRPLEFAYAKWVQTYGLTSLDLRAIAALPNVVGAVPVRRFPHESRHLEYRHESVVVGATPELADMLPLPLEAGRFLSADDMRERRNVAVLGADVADALFPGEDPLSQTIVLNRESYVVIGVLEDGGASDPITAARHASILVPLSTCQCRFGEKIILRTGGSRRAEAVELSDIYVTLHRSQDLPGIVESIRELLVAAHEKQDWAVSAAVGR
jgi:hypothetical protein